MLLRKMESLSALIEFNLAKRTTSFKFSYTIRALCVIGDVLWTLVLWHTPSLNQVVLKSERLEKHQSLAKISK
jgi:hypothetical protein